MGAMLYNLTIPEYPEFQRFKSKWNERYVWGDAGSPVIKFLSRRPSPFDIPSVWQVYETGQQGNHNSNSNLYFVDMYDEEAHKSKIDTFPLRKLIRECTNDRFLMIGGTTDVLAVFPELGKHRKSVTGRLIVYRLQFECLEGEM